MSDVPARFNDRRCAQLEWILFGLLDGLVSLEDVLHGIHPHRWPHHAHEVSLLDLERPVGLFGVIDDQGKGDVCLIPEMSRHGDLAHPDSNNGRAAVRYLLIPAAQLRNVLAAERSAVVPEPDDDRRFVRPKVSEPGLDAMRFREPQVFDVLEVGHAAILGGQRRLPTGAL